MFTQLSYNQSTFLSQRFNDDITDEYLSAMDPSEPNKQIRYQIYALIRNRQAVHEYCYQPHYSPSSSKLPEVCNVHQQLNPYNEQQSEVTVNGHFHVHNMVVIAV